MLASLSVFLLNSVIAARNLWRRLRRRQLDYVELTLSGGLAEFTDRPPRWQRIVLQARPGLSVAFLRRLFRRIAADPRPRGVVLRIDGLAAGWATLQSLRAAIADLRASGKRVVVYLITPDLSGTYVACAADTVLMPPTVYWSVLGIRAEVQFLRDALARWGIEVEATAVSPYKSAPDTLTRTDFTPESRAQFERLIELRYTELVRAIAEGRGTTPDIIRALIDRAPLAPRAALDAGLVDGLCYEDELAERLKAAESDRLPTILAWPQAARALRIQPAGVHRKQIALVRVEGSIMRGSDRRSPLPLPLIGGTLAGSESLAQALRKAERNRRIAAVVLYVNSPGGEVFASDLMWREVLRLRKQKPVVVAMGNTAASGGYYLAAHASALVAQPGSVTGSIGVFSLRPVAAGLLEQAAIHTTIISRGANSGLLGGTQQPTESERTATQAQIAGLYDDFLVRVGAGRRISAEQLEPLAGGRVWLGSEAAINGLIDQLGGVPEAMALAQELAGLPQQPDAPLVTLSGGGQLPPVPFPADDPTAPLLAAVELLRPRAWALLPFEVIDGWSGHTT